MPILIADAEAFPPWMIWTTLAFASGAVGMFLVGRRRAIAEIQPPTPLVQPPSEEPPPPLPPMALAAAPIAKTNPMAERRAGYRRVGNPVEVLICDQGFTTPPRRAWVVDRSRLGVRLSTHEKLASGTILNIKPASAKEDSAWQSIEVRNAQPAEQSWELGCRFTSEPPWDVLLLYG